MSVSRDTDHKRKATGGLRKQWRKKRAYQIARQAAMTKLTVGKDADKRIRVVRVRGGNTKLRALRLNTGNFCWGSECSTRKTRILDVVYNASNNELTRTKTLVKGAIVSIDATPFRQWFENYYGVPVKATSTEAPSNLTKEQEQNLRNIGKIDSQVADQMLSGRVLARISSRPGQCGRADGYILEGDELTFYVKKMSKK
ncbi:hypothetical protein P9112_007396 [Eukaryota sp. TZLM1-RC]